MSKPQGGLQTSTLLRSFPIWPGVFVGLWVAFALLGLQLFGLLSRDLDRVLGWIMTLAHGMIAFAIVTLLGQAMTIARCERALIDRRSRLSEAAGTDPLLDEPIDLEAFRAEIQRTTRELSERCQETRSISLIVAYVVPLIGLVAATWGADKKDFWSIVNQPLFLSLSESFFVLLVAMGVCNSSEVVKTGWLLLSPTKVTGHTVADSFDGLKTFTRKPSA